MGITIPDTTTPTGRTKRSVGYLRALPERQRLAVFLRYYADLSYDQIAEVLQVRSGTVAAALNAAHRNLRDELEGVTT